MKNTRNNWLFQYITITIYLSWCLMACSAIISIANFSISVSVETVGVLISPLFVINCWFLLLTQPLVFIWSYYLLFRNIKYYKKVLSSVSVIFLESFGSIIIHMYSCFSSISTALIPSFSEFFIPLVTWYCVLG